MSQLAFRLTTVDNDGHLQKADSREVKQGRINWRDDFRDLDYCEVGCIVV